MKYRYMLPSRSLAEYVDYYFIIEKERFENAVPVEVLPAPQAEMVFTYGDERSSYSVIGENEEHLSSDYAVSGFFTKKATYRNNSRLGVVMVGFKPWGIQPFIDFSIAEITNQKLDFKNIFPSKIRILEDELRAAKTDDGRVGVIEKFLLSILRSHKPDRLVNEAVKQMNQFNGQIPVRELASRFHLCEKQFKRRFVRTIGITPKLFSRLVRFQYILNLMDKAQVKPLILQYRQASTIRRISLKNSRILQIYLEKVLQNNLKTDLGSYFEDQIKIPFYNTIYK